MVAMPESDNEIAIRDQRATSSDCSAAIIPRSSRLDEIKVLVRHDGGLIHAKTVTVHSLKMLLIEFRRAPLL